jgi:biotin transport system substrate-specific component
MAKSAVGTMQGVSALRTSDWLGQIAVLLGATLFVAVCAHVSIPIPGTPVPLTLQNFAVVLVGLLLGRKRAFAALTVYLAEGVAGLPVFSPAGPGGIMQLFGATGGYLMAYPVAAGVAGWIFSGEAKSFMRATIAGVAAEVVLFAGGIGWLAFLTQSWARAIHFGLYWFVFAEVIKVMFAAAIATRTARTFEE